MRLAFITPRYGAEITSGAEHACRLLADRAAVQHDVDVITTCARNQTTWKNEYVEGTDKVRGVVVRRFKVSEPHDADTFRELSSRLFTTTHSRADEIEWAKRLGPSAPGLVDHIKRQHRNYDALVFFSLYHATTVDCVGIAPERSIVFPHVALSSALRFGLWADILRSTRAIGLLSGAERRLIREFIQLPPSAEELIGIGINPSPQESYPRHQEDPADAQIPEEDIPVLSDVSDERSHLTGRGVPFKRRHRLYGSFALYGGRVEPDNGCEEMLEYFDTFAAADGDTSLVLMGPKMMKVPDERYVRLAGMLPDRERMVAYEAADVTIAPSSNDLLSQSLLESLAVGTPVLASARNDAAVEHCRRSNGGLYYATRDEFVAALHLMTTDTAVRERLGENGREYVRLHFSWDSVLARFERLVSRVRPR